MTNIYEFMVALDSVMILTGIPFLQ